MCILSLKWPGEVEKYLDLGRCLDPPWLDDRFSSLDQHDVSHAIGEAIMS